MNGQLVFLNGPLDDQKIDIMPIGKTTLGRLRSCQTRLKAEGVSREHCHGIRRRAEPH